MQNSPQRFRASKPSRRDLLRALSAGSVAAIAGCLGDDGKDGDSHEPDSEVPERQSDLSGPVAATSVGMQSDPSHRFEPPVVWIERGGSVTWELESGAHDAVAYHPENSDHPLRIPEEASPWDTEMLSEPGGTIKRTFESKGVYDYFCSPHQYRGMVGTVIVGHPEAEGQPGLAPPQDDLPQEARAQLTDLNEVARNALTGD